MVKTNDGTLIYVSEARQNSTGDDGAFSIMMRRSEDNGVTWSGITIIYSDTSSTINNPTMVVDSETGTLFLLFTKNNSTVYVMSSTDSGVHWSTPTDITSSVKVTAAGNPNPESFPDTPWGWYVVGPGHGIQMQNGPHAGRLVVTGDHRIGSTTGSVSWSHIIYSDDHGQTWHLGGGLSQADPVNSYSNENMVAELNDGTLYMNIRVKPSEFRATRVALTAA